MLNFYEFDINSPRFNKIVFGYFFAKILKNRILYMYIGCFSIHFADSECDMWYLFGLLRLSGTCRRTERNDICARFGILRFG